MHTAIVIKLINIANTELVNSNGKPYNVILSCDPIISWLPHPINTPPKKQLRTDFNLNRIGLKEFTKKPVITTAMKNRKKRIKFSVLFLKLFFEISLITCVYDQGVLINNNITKQIEIIVVGDPIIFCEKFKSLLLDEKRINKKTIAKSERIKNEMG